MNKKRKICDENRIFQEKWIKQEAIFIVCHKSIAIMKEYNLKRHYGKKYAAKFDVI